MAESALQAIKDASVFIRAEGSTGSGYVVAPGFIGTALHVVKDWRPGQAYEVLVGSGGTREKVMARRGKVDEAADAALLEVEGPLKAKPLPVATALSDQVAWQGYGYPALANKTEAPAGLPTQGQVRDPSTTNDAGQPAVLLYSSEAAAGNASPLHGFSGSPVVVDGALIGHLVKHIGDRDDKGRAAYGFVYACPIARVTALLDVPPVPTPIAPKPLPTQRELNVAALPLAPDEYHVFVSYRSTDRKWAMALVARLEGAGLKVFIDQQELEPGQYLAQQLADSMKRSRAAVVLVSGGWLASPWCQQEQQVLTQRAVEQSDFVLVPLRLDASEVPTLLNSRMWLDFSDRGFADGPDGPMLQRLIDTLLKRAAGRQYVAQPAALTAALAAERAVTDEFVLRIRSAALGDVSAIMLEVRAWQRTTLDDTAPLITAAEAYIGKGAFELALGVLTGAASSLRVRQLAAFAKRKLGHIDEARIELIQLQREGALDAETAGLLAGTYKAQWLKTGDSAFLKLAYQTYREAFDRSGDPFVGINAAALSLYEGNVNRAYDLAGQVLVALDKKPRNRLDHWDKATYGEAYALRKRMDDARDWYDKAAAAAAGRPQDIAVMRRQARMNLKALGRDEHELDAVLPVPRVLAYAGHRTDAPGRSPARFPGSKSVKVREAIRRELLKLGPVHGFGSAASGTDLLVLQELQARRLTASVVLPFPEADFVQQSVSGAWQTMFEDLRDNGKPRIEFLAPLQLAAPPADQMPQAFKKANDQVRRLAMEYAARLDETVVVIVVWDQKPGDGPGGTAHAVELWQVHGIEPIIIDPTQL